MLNLPVIEVSSSEIRDKIRNGEDTGSLVDKDVLDYISAGRLYRD